MNNRLLDLLIEFDEMGYAPTTVCEDAEEYAKKWKNRVLEEFKTLEAENAALRERLEKTEHRAEVAEKIVGKALSLLSGTSFEEIFECSSCPVKDKCNAKCTNECANLWKNYLTNQAKKNSRRKGKMTYCIKCGKPTDNGIMCEDCIISDSPWLLAMKRKEDDLVEQNEKLKAENAALRERLEKAVEFPFENLDKVFILAGEDTNEKQFIPDRIVEDTIVGFGYDVYENEKQFIPDRIVEDTIVGFGYDVYENEKQFIPDRIVEGTIVGFGYDVYEWVDGNYKFNYHVLVGENNYIFALEQFNKTLFKTREAAEARLEELKGEKL